MSERKFETIEEDGIIIYDESDDYVPEEDDDSEFLLLTNEEIFTDDYMSNYSDRMDAKITREKRVQRLVSLGVVLAVIAYTGFLIAVFI